MRTNKKNHIRDRKNNGTIRRTGKKTSDSRKNHFIPERERLEDDPAGEEILSAFLSELFGDGEASGNMPPMFGVIELDPENGISLKVQHPDYMNNTSRKQKSTVSGKAVSGRREPEPLRFEGCGEEVFLSMLADLNAMMKIILESDHMMRMVCEADVAQEDARCVTYLGVREGRDILKKWNKYRNCNT